MKKIFIIMISTFISLLSTPIFAQLDDPGADPDAPTAPVDGYLWVMIAIGLVYVFLRFKAVAQRQNESK